MAKGLLQSCAGRVRRLLELATFEKTPVPAISPTPLVKIGYLAYPASKVSGMLSRAVTCPF